MVRRAFVSVVVVLRLRGESREGLPSFFLGQWFTATSDRTRAPYVWSRLPCSVAPILSPSRTLSLSPGQLGGRRQSPALGQAKRWGG